MITENKIGVVIIGRNEGSRLIDCLSSVNPNNNVVVYVDSNSTDNSVENAKEAGAQVIDLDMSIPFSAARARNAGWKYLIEQNPDIEYIQFVDGDCELQSQWLIQAESFLRKNTQYAIVSGRLRERFPDASLYNKFCDDEWNTPAGEATACGGNAFIRVECLIQVDGYKNYFIAGEEPEMCYRLREKGYKIFHLSDEMALHDANMTNFQQWWKRAMRYGFASALTASEHGLGKERLGLREIIRSLFWTGLLALTILISLFNPFFLLFILIIPLQILRMYTKKKDKSLYSLISCTFLMIAKVPESIGILKFVFNRIRKQPLTIIEHK